MSDDFDLASEREDQERERAVEAARFFVPMDKQAGPLICARCGEKNDRAARGFATCSDCVE